LVAAAKQKQIQDTSGGIHLSGTRTTRGIKNSSSEEAHPTSGRELQSNRQQLKELHMFYTNADGLVNKRKELEKTINALDQRPSNHGSKA
jgi:hypothetical protein